MGRQRINGKGISRESELTVSEWLSELRQDFSKEWAAVRKAQPPSLRLGLLKVMCNLPFCISLVTPFFQIYVYLRERRISSEVKIGRTWHDIPYDIKHQKSLIKHLKEHW